MKSSALCGLAALLAGLAVAAGMQGNCKRVIMNYVLEECSGFRGKRSLPRELVEPASGPESAIKESRLRKRQAVTLSEIIMTSKVPIYNYQYPHGPSYIGTVYVPVVPATVADDYKVEKKHEGLPKEKNSELGFDMDDKQLEELFEELYDRLPRSPNQSVNDVHDEFMKSAYGCCMNKEQCKSMRALIDCP